MSGRLVITPKVQEILRTLPPEIKRYIRRAFLEIRQDPLGGKLLRDDLTGLRSFRVKRFRIIYRTHPQAAAVVVVGVGPRETIYGQMSAAVRSGPVG